VITLFTIAKPFRDHIEIIQRNAINSWKASCPDAEIVVYGDDYGTAQVCEELEVDHGGAVGRSEFGRFLVSDAFEKVRLRSRFELLGYLNCDIMLLDDFRKSVETLIRMQLPEFVMSARRHSFEATARLSLSEQAERDFLRCAVQRYSSLDGFSALDCFVYPRSYRFDMPAFAVGEIAWDNWMINHALRRGVPVIDATEDCVLIHQSHEQLSAGPYSSEAKRNLALAGGMRNVATLRDATCLLCGGVLTAPGPFRRTYLSLTKLGAVRKLLYSKRLTKRFLLKQYSVLSTGANERSPRSSGHAARA
jgi:hypothetical protein